MSTVNLKLFPLFILSVCSSVFSRAQCHADFIYSQNGFVVQFMDNSTTNTGSNIGHYYWSFGDGMYSTSQNPVHTYSAPGAYTVRHIISTNTGTCSDTVVKMVFIDPPPQQQVDVCPQDTIWLQSWRQAGTYQWQVSTDSINYINITPSVFYSGTSSPVLTIYKAPTSFAHYRYRCLADSTISTVYTLRFANYFTGSASAIWSNPSNWSCGAIPDMHTDVVIPNGQVMVNSNVTVRSLQVEPGVTVTLQPGVVITVLR